MYTETNLVERLAQLAAANDPKGQLLRVWAGIALSAVEVAAHAATAAQWDEAQAKADALVQALSTARTQAGFNHG